MLRNAHIRAALLASFVAPFVLEMAGTGTAAADPPQAYSGEQILPPPPTYQANGVTVNEKTGARIPLDATFRTQDGALVTLGDVVIGSGLGRELPTILTFNYADCPMLCSLQLNGLSKVLPELATPAKVAASSDPDRDVAFAIGTQFRIISIDLEPTESLDKLAKMKERYIARLPERQQAAARAGWTFLAAAKPGEDAQIKRIADAVGFSYVYVEDRAEWAHPAALIFLSTTGVVTRYVYGIDFEPAIMRESIIKAGLAEAATAVGFMNRCYHFDPDAKNFSRAGVLTLRLGAVGFLVLLVAGLGVMHVARRRRTSSVLGRPEES